MIDFHCSHPEVRRHGYDRRGDQRFRCKLCGVTFLEPQSRPLGDMRLPIDRAVFCLRLLLEGNSIRSTERLTAVHRDTLMSLLFEVGSNCSKLIEAKFTDLEVSLVEVDELWGFVGCKSRTQERTGRDERYCGDAYCFTAIERDTKLLFAWHLGKRTAVHAQRFAAKLRRATSGRFQLTTDGFRPYQTAVPGAFGNAIDFAQLVKQYATASEEEQRRYSPPRVVGCDKIVRIGEPDVARISTSIVERSNLTLRMGIRRLTRLTNAFSKKWENHEAALALYFAYYDFARIHSTLKTTPAVAQGLEDHVWSVRELVERAATDK